MVRRSVTLAGLGLASAGLLSAGISLLPASEARADDEKSVCIRTLDIDHTAIPDENTILFYMRGGKVWKNTLTSRCYGLKFQTRGFTYTPTLPGTNEMCSNLQTIHLNDTGNTCFLGAFTPFDPKSVPPKP